MDVDFQLQRHDLLHNETEMPPCFLSLLAAFNFVCIFVMVYVSLLLVVVVRHLEVPVERGMPDRFLALVPLLPP